MGNSLQTFASFCQVLIIGIKFSYMQNILSNVKVPSRRRFCCFRAVEVALNIKPKCSVTFQTYQLYYCQYILKAIKIRHQCDLMYICNEERRIQPRHEYVNLSQKRLNSSTTASIKLRRPRQIGLLKNLQLNVHQQGNNAK